MLQGIKYKQSLTQCDTHWCAAECSGVINNYKSYFTRMKSCYNVTSLHAPSSQSFLHAQLGFCHHCDVIISHLSYQTITITMSRRSVLLLSVANFDQVSSSNKLIHSKHHCTLIQDLTKTSRRCAAILVRFAVFLKCPN